MHNFRKVRTIRSMGTVENSTGGTARSRVETIAETIVARIERGLIRPGAEENRGITLREAATLQTFPHDYDFVGGYDQVERQIGNAVPVRMVERIAGQIRGMAETRACRN